MFDRGLISLSDDLLILVSRQVNDLDAVRTFINPSGSAFPPLRNSERPHPHFLHWHREHCFKQWLVGWISPTGPRKARPDDRLRRNPPYHLTSSCSQRRVTHSLTCPTLEAAVRVQRLNRRKKFAGRCRFPKTRFVVPMQGRWGRLKHGTGERQCGRSSPLLVSCWTAPCSR